MTTTNATPAPVAATKPMLTYGDAVKVDWQTIVTNGVAMVLAQRTLNHIMGNECAAALSAAQNRDKNPVKKDDASVKAFNDEWRKEKLASLLDGTFTIRQSGPRLKGLDWYINDVARTDVENALKKHYRENPKAKKLDAKAVTQKVADYIKAAGPAITKRAEKAMADAESQSPDVLKAIGLAA